MASNKLIFTILFTILFINQNQCNSFPLFSMLFESSCKDNHNVNTNAIIIGHNVIKSKNTTLIENNKHDTNNKNTENILSYIYNGLITISYKTLSYCEYECTFDILINQSKPKFVIEYMKNYYTIGYVIPGNCSKNGCIFKNGICNVIKKIDEL